MGSDAGHTSVHAELLAHDEPGLRGVMLVGLAVSVP
jgi:hypothetical protein